MVGLTPHFIQKPRRDVPAERLYNCVECLYNCVERLYNSAERLYNSAEHLYNCVECRKIVI